MMSPTSPGSPLLTLRQAADEIGKPERTLRDWVRQGKFPCLPRERGDHIFVSRCQIEEWLRTNHESEPDGKRDLLPRLLEMQTLINRAIEECVG